MNEFIVWDKTLECFTLSNYVKLENGILKPIGEDYTIYKGIGLKDINKKNIYANCSIVEFKWGQNKHTIIGYFTYNKEYLCYEIIMLNAQKGKSMCYAPHNCFNIKIIDTVQENKLVLIK